MRTATPTSSRVRAPGGPRASSETSSGSRRSQPGVGVPRRPAPGRSKPGSRTERTGDGGGVDGDLDRLEAGHRQRPVPRQVDGERRRPSRTDSASGRTMPSAIVIARHLLRSAGQLGQQGEVGAGDARARRRPRGRAARGRPTRSGRRRRSPRRPVPEPGAVRRADRLDVRVPELGVGVPDRGQHVRPVGRLRAAAAAEHAGDEHGERALLRCPADDGRGPSRCARRSAASAAQARWTLVDRVVRQAVAAQRGARASGRAGVVRLKSRVSPR